MNQLLVNISDLLKSLIQMEVDIDKKEETERWII